MTAEGIETLGPKPPTADAPSRSGHPVSDRLFAAAAVAGRPTYAGAGERTVICRPRLAPTFRSPRPSSPALRGHDAAEWG